MAEIKLRKVKGVHEFEVIERVFGDERAHREVQRISGNLGAEPYVVSLVDIYVGAESGQLESNEAPRSLDDINLFYGKPIENGAWQITALTNDVLHIKIVAEEVYDPEEIEKHLKEITCYFEKDSDPFEPILRNYLEPNQRGAVILDTTDRSIVVSN